FCLTVTHWASPSLSFSLFLSLSPLLLSPLLSILHPLSSPLLSSPPLFSPLLSPLLLSPPLSSPLLCSGLCSCVDLLMEVGRCRRQTQGHSSPGTSSSHWD